MSSIYQGINPRELRIGNFISDSCHSWWSDNDTSYITSINNRFCTISTDKRNRGFNEIYPIGITGNGLFRLGFQRRAKRCSYSLGSIILTPNFNNEYCCESHTLIHPALSKEYEIRFVHELQNILFYLPKI